MDISIGLDLAVLIIGLCIYGLTVGKAVEIGRLMFFAGLLAVLFHASGTLHLH